jgi:hypothetical protein
MSPDGRAGPQGLAAELAGAQLVVHAVVRNRHTEGLFDALQGLGNGPAFRLVGSGEIAAVVTSRTADSDEAESLSRHARLVARLLRRRSVVPIPNGLVAEGDEAVRGFLDAQRVPLLEALDFLEDGYELRLHVSAQGAAPTEDRLRTIAHHVYEQLQRQARAARILSEGGAERILSAAFLISRTEWIGFVEQISDWEGRYPAIRLDVTGPWAAWDFVQVMTAGQAGQREET